MCMEVEHTMDPRCFLPSLAGNVFYVRGPRQVTGDKNSNVTKLVNRLMCDTITIWNVVLVKW